jgi:hypothetical protein
MNAVTPGWQFFVSFVQMASMMLQVKKGTQHIKKTPATFDYEVINATAIGTRDATKLTINLVLLRSSGR